jgi:hypothetical protein
MNLPLVLVCSCKKNTNLHEFYINVFKNKIDFLIILGGESDNFIKDNFLYLNCEDSYEMLHQKMYLAYTFLYKTIKKNILKIDDDSFLDINKFLNYKFNSDIEGFIFPGNFCNYSYHENKVSDTRFKQKISDTNLDPYLFCMGGGYFLNRKALKYIIKNAPNTVEFNNHLSFKKGREDRMIGQSFSKNLEKFKIKNNGYWIIEDTDNNNFMYSVMSDLIIHPFKKNELEVLYNKRKPRLWALRVKK